MVVNLTLKKRRNKKKNYGKKVCKINLSLFHAVDLVLSCIDASNWLQLAEMRARWNTPYTHISSKISWLFVYPLTDYIRNVGIFFSTVFHRLPDPFLIEFCCCVFLFFMLCVCCVLYGFRFFFFNTIPFAIRKGDKTIV